MTADQPAGGADWCYSCATRVDGRAPRFVPLIGTRLRARRCPRCEGPVRPAEERDLIARPSVPDGAAPMPSTFRGGPAPADTSWVDAPDQSVPPWRRADRERVEDARDAARTAAESPKQQTEVALSHEIHRLAGLHSDGALTTHEFIAGVESLLAP